MDEHSACVTYGAFAKSSSFVKRLFPEEQPGIVVHNPSRRLAMKRDDGEFNGKNTAPLQTVTAHNNAGTSGYGKMQMYKRLVISKGNIAGTGNDFVWSVKIQLAVGANFLIVK
jgi:hypothetical protein